MHGRCRSVGVAIRVPRRTIKLVECPSCGLIFNASFDSAAVPYDDNYDNRCMDSPSFAKYLEDLAVNITAHHGLREASVLEVGCGKGDFLKLFCRLSGSRGRGFDPTYSPGPPRPGRNVTFFPRYIADRDLGEPIDALFCRHVIEHVPQIGEFLQKLHLMAKHARCPLVVLETPLFEWIVRNQCSWDVFYEHCNYFTAPALRHLCRKAGFRVIRYFRSFGGQYQVIELLPGSPRLYRKKSQPRPLLEKFMNLSNEKLRQLESVVPSEKDGGWGVWGAGAKGVTLATRIRKKPRLLVDVNPGKQGGFVPGNAIPIVGPKDSRILGLSLIAISNPNYSEEIRNSLKAAGFRGKILPLT